MVKRFFIELSFNGSKYHGWQMQDNAESLQAAVTNALNCILGIDTEITGAGRTDTGVHARNYIAHFDIQQKKLKYPPKKLVFKLNSFLPPDIVIHDIYEVKPDIHARFSAVSRTYCYYISRTKDPFSRDFSTYIYGALDIKKMNQAARILLKTSDFKAFSKSGSDNKSTICNVTQACWEEKENMLVFTITANRFLRNMVRAIVGTMLELGKGKSSLDDFKKIIESRDRSDAGTSVPACGLFLEKIDYPGNIRKG